MLETRDIEAEIRAGKKPKDGPKLSEKVKLLSALRYDKVFEDEHNLSPNNELFERLFSKIALSTNGENLEDHVTAVLLNLRKIAARRKQEKIKEEYDQMLSSSERIQSLTTQLEEIRKRRINLDLDEIKKNEQALNTIFNEAMRGN